MIAIRIALVVAVTLGASAPATVRGEEEAPPKFLRLEYRAVTTNESVGEDVKRKAPLVPRTEETLTAVLGPRRVEIVEGKRRTVLDHERERVLRVEPDGSYGEISLLAYFAFVDMEMANRVKLAEGLGAAGIADASMEPREVSILFGWRAKGDDTAVASAADGAATVFRVGEEELSRWTPGTEKLDDAQRASLARFLQHRCRLHPAVREAIVADGRAPAALRFRWLDVGTRSVTELTLLTAKRASEAGSTPLGRRVFDESDALARIARRVLDPSKEDTAARLAKDDFVRLAREARKGGRYEDAALLLIECGLQTGDAVTDELRDLRTEEGAEERILRVLGTLGLNEPQRTIDGVQQLDRAAFSRPHVLDVFRGNALAAADRHDEGLKTMLSALEGSPWLTGAWKDVGDMYYMRFDTQRAWLAWEAGRHSAPEHPMLKPVGEYEGKLRKKYRDLL